MKYLILALCLISTPAIAQINVTNSAPGVGFGAATAGVGNTTAVTGASTANGPGSGNTTMFTSPTQAPPVAAPALAIAGPCTGAGASAGASFVGVGASAGYISVDADCTTRANATTLYQMGARDAAFEVMCSNKQVRSAMLATGSPCIADRAKMADQPAPVRVVQVAPKQYPKCGVGITDNCVSGP